MPEEDIYVSAICAIGEGHVLPVLLVTPTGGNDVARPKWPTSSEQSRAVANELKGATTDQTGDAD